VFDGAAAVQAKIDAVMRIAEAARAYGQQVEQVRQGAQQVIHMVKSVEMQAKNLMTMPQGGSVFDWVNHLSGQSSLLLGYIQGIGFSLDESTKQFATLYGDASKMSTAEGRAVLLARAQQARMEMMGVAVQVQSIRTTFMGIHDRLKALLSASSVAEGARALAEVQIHQHALVQQQAQLGLTMQAVNDRLAVMKDAEELLIKQMHTIAAQHLAEQWYGGGRLALPPNFNGFRLSPR
jgi:ribosomal protein L34